jgi:hypothetical protein
MNITRSMLREIIEKERKILNEDCGCGCNGSPGGCGDSYEDEDMNMKDVNMEDLPQFIDYEESYDYDIEAPMMSKEESLKAVYAIANSTSCPLTRDALLGVISDLMQY